MVMLKALLHKSFTLVLAIAILFSATGVTVFKMVCSKSKTYNVSLSQFDDCCKKNKCSSCTLNDNCCGFIKSTVSSVQQYVHLFVFNINIAVTDLIGLIGSFSFAKETSPVAFADYATFGITGKQILLLASKFTI